MTFEQANKKLEETVNKMENSSLSLQESMEYYAQACELLAFCMKELDSCKGKIEDINERLDRMKQQ